jgi:hypothetical protein
MVVAMRFVSNGRSLLLLLYLLVLLLRYHLIVSADITFTADVSSFNYLITVRLFASFKQCEYEAKLHGNLFERLRQEMLLLLLQ